jgi:uncharacterized membrane protein
VAEPVPAEPARHARPPHRWTSLVLRAGTTAAGACLAVGMLLAVLAPDRSGTAHDLGGLARSLVALEAWGWSMLGALVLMATPAVGLLVTAAELRGPEPRAALLALAVLGVLAVAVLFALA